MAFFKVKKDAEAVRDTDSNGSKYINKSGIYDILIKEVIVDRSPSGSEYINLFFEYDGQPQTIYTAIRLTNKDGSENFEAALFNKLCIILGGGDEIEIDDPIEKKCPIGANGAMKDCAVLEQFEDAPITVRIQMEYSLYNGEIQQKKRIKNFFDSVTHLTASEIINGVEEAKQYEKEMAYADKTVYKDDLTETDIQDWINSRRSGRDTSAKAASKPAAGKRSFSIKK